MLLLQALRGAGHSAGVDADWSCCPTCLSRDTSVDFKLRPSSAFTPAHISTHQHTHVRARQRLALSQPGYKDLHMLRVQACQA